MCIQRLTIAWCKLSTFAFGKSVYMTLKTDGVRHQCLHIYFNTGNTQIRVAKHNMPQMFSKSLDFQWTSFTQGLKRLSHTHTANTHTQFPLICPDIRHVVLIESHVMKLLPAAEELVMLHVSCESVLWEEFDEWQQSQ